MSSKSMKASLPMTYSRFGKSFICRIVEGRNHSGVLKLPSAFAVEFGSVALKNIGLHMPFCNTCIGRFDSSSETIEGVDSLLQKFNANPWYLVVLEHFGGTEFTIEIFNEYAVEVDYLCKPSRGLAKPLFFPMNEIEKEKMQHTFSYSSCSAFELECEVVLTAKHLEGNRWTEVILKEDGLHIGLSPEMDWVEIGFEKLFWRIKLQWHRAGLLFGPEWNEFCKCCKLGIDDRCIFTTCTHEGQCKVAVCHKEKSKEVYKEDNVAGKGYMKWFKIINWLNVHTGELEIPIVFVEKCGAFIKDNAQIYLPDGMVFSCYFSKTTKLLFGIKNLMVHYGVGDKFSMFFEYVGNSTFYCSIYNEEGVEIFNELTKKLSLQTVRKEKGRQVYVITDSDEDEGEAGGEEVDEEQSGYAEPEEEDMEAEGQYNFTVELLKSHVDQNNHGVFLPRYLFGLYKKWNKGTLVTLIMESKSYEIANLRRKKTCRLGVGWNNFTLKNNLRVGKKLHFKFRGNTTFEVTATD